MHHPTDRIAHTMAFVTPVMENWLERDLEGRKEGNVLFNDALNTFYLQLYDIRHIVKDHSDSERGNPLLQQVFFYMHHPTDRISHTTAFVTPVVEHWLEQEIAQWVSRLSVGFV